ncbi:MAG: NAD(P)-dependent oxidoreductase [Chloroflexi bacterium]|nr:NAD(P)-dependent oxidoreductase [Chloroflexota bacterium]
MSAETFLITGAMGCIGAWVLRNLAAEGVRVVATDLATDPVRPGLVMTPEALAQVTFVQLDITDLKALQTLVEQRQVTHIIHLAGLQVPFCKANPSLGARVNVVGTVNIFEAARHFRDQVRGLSYASSLAVLGPDHLYSERPILDNAPLYPGTLYGVYKQANEETARIYWQDWQVGSVGLRPYVVYGVGRDQGMTSGPAKAILAAAAGRPYEIKFDGPVALQYVDDVARMFIEAARAGYTGAAVCNLRNDVVTVADFIAALQAEAPAAQITCAAGNPLPFPADLDDGGLRAILGDIPHTPLPMAIRATLSQFKSLLADNRIDLSQLAS